MEALAEQTRSGGASLPFDSPPGEPVSGPLKGEPDAVAAVAVGTSPLAAAAAAVAAAGVGAAVAAAGIGAAVGAQQAGAS